MGDRKAWRATTRDGRDAGICFAATRGQAQNLSLLNAREAGHKLGWTDIRVHRAQEYDRLAEGSRGIMAEWYARALTTPAR